MMSSDFLTYHGIIPAYAGNTFTQWVDQTKNRDHPRVCGEHVEVVSYRRTFGGSSPRMRGTPAQGQHFEYVPGIIPAYAGNTEANGGNKADAGDHPRVCGEHKPTGITVSP